MFGKWIFNNNYGNNLKFGMATGVYNLINIPKEHPLAIIPTNNNIYTGNKEKMFKKLVNGIEYNFYYGHIEFDYLSLYSYKDGFMGGKNIIVYSEVCKHPPETPVQKICGKKPCHVCLNGSPALSCAKGCGNNKEHWYITGLVENSKFSQDYTGDSCFISTSYENEDDCINQLGNHTKLCADD